MDNTLRRLGCISLVWIAAAAVPAAAKVGGKIVVGFSQIGAESAWRIANTKSIRDAATKAGIVLVYSDAQQKQENQIKAIKKFILQKVDVIVLAPVVSAGWHEVLTQAKDAGIPVILADREVDEKDLSLYTTFIGADFYEEGRRAAQCLITEFAGLGLKGPLRIVELRGTDGSTPQRLRQKGFADQIAKQPGAKVVRSESGDFKEALGKEWMQKILSETGGKPGFNALYAHNDNMALGAIAELRTAGLGPGKNIVIVSVDAIKEAFQAMSEGKLNCTVECSPLLGPQLMSAVQDLVEGRGLPRRIITKEGVFPSKSARSEYGKREY